MALWGLGLGAGLEAMYGLFVGVFVPPLGLLFGPLLGGAYGTIAGLARGIMEAALGNGLEWSIQSWVSTTGRKVRIAEEPWLEGPIGDKYIGAEFYESYAREVGLDAVTNDDDAGLLPSLDALAGEQFDPSLVRDSGLLRADGTL